ncbi:Cutinase transcription factor 1 alpha [Choanephora cucurbitarum]|uniref:Cutinase transcription factor 1 alpha n=1 Tax=Choanephora cucurbitarum TaxID=101091 RepID=A0A1C7NAL8_9FUNG|nr:Cutinase transcription factor 1 alpha [Choanephora cucurbitarum]
MTKKRGPPKGYIEAIENRLYKLENFLAEMAKNGDAGSKRLLSELNSPLETPTGEQIRARPVRRVPRSERNKVFFWQQDKAGRRKRESLMEGYETEEPDDKRQKTKRTSIDEGLGQLSMDENGQVRYLGKSSGYYLLQNSRTYQNGAFHFASYGNRPQYRRSANINSFELPPKDLSEHLVQLYFKHFYPFLPLFYKRQLCPKDAVTPLLMNAIYAVASRISPDARVRSDPEASETAGDIFFERAEKLLDESYDTPSISTIQALLLLASHQHGAMKSAKAWLYSGMAFRMAQDLGLHRNCDHWNIPLEECERRKRVFWCCYIVDRLASAMYGRASTFEERDCDVPFPSIDDDTAIEDDSIDLDNPDNSPPSVSLLELFANLIKICDILGHILKNIYYVRSLQYAGVRQVDAVLTTWNKKLHQWYDQLPDSLQIKKNDKQHSVPSTAICQLHMIYHTTVILLHRPFIPGPSQSLIPTMMPCASICSAAADAILSIADTMMAEGKLKYVMSYCVYYIFTSGIIFIGAACPKKKDDPALLSSDNRSLEAKFKLRQCMLALDKIEATWVTASKNCQILAELSGFRDIDFQVSEQQEKYNHGLWNHPSSAQPFLPPQISSGHLSSSPPLPSSLPPPPPPPQQQQQSQHFDSNSSHSSGLLRSISPQSSRTSSPQLQNENTPYRVNASNLRFPIVRIDPKSGQEDAVSNTRAIHSNPKIEFSSSNTFHSNRQMNNATTSDPFAAQGVVSLALSRQYDSLGPAFWGVPSNLDDWNSFISSNMSNTMSQSSYSSVTDMHPNLQEKQNTEIGMMDDYVHVQEKQRLIHTDQNVDMLSGVSVPFEQSVMSSPVQHHHGQASHYMIHRPSQLNEVKDGSQTAQNEPQRSITSTHPITSSSLTVDGRPSINLQGDLANAYYW